jgi:O-antigen/teichoic acid export membrane protein
MNKPKLRSFNLWDKKLLKKISGVFIVNIAGLASSYLLQIVLTRSIDLNSYGTFIYVIALSTVVSNFVGLGLPVANLRYIPIYIIKENWRFLRGIIDFSLKSTVVLSTAISLISTPVLFIINSTNEIQMLFPLLAGVWMVPVFAVINLQTEILKAFKKASLSLFSFNLLYPSLLIVGISSLTLARIEITLYVCLFSALIALAAVLLFQCRMIRIYAPEEINNVKPSYQSYAEWLRVSLALLAERSFSYLLKQHIDILLIGVFSTVEEVALYNVAFRFASLVNVALSAANSVSAPLFSSLYEEGRKSELQKLVSQESFYIFVSSLIIGLSLIMSSTFFLGIFGQDYLQARWLMIILLGGQMVNAGAGSVGYLLNMTGHQNHTARVIGWSALFNLIVNLILVPRLGSLGAAIGTSLSIVLWNLWLAFTVEKYVGIRPSIIGTIWPKRFD